MPVPIRKADSGSPRKLFSYPAFAAISQGTQIRKYCELFEPRVETQTSKPHRNPLYNENVVIIEIAEYPDPLIRGEYPVRMREPWKSKNQELRAEELPQPDTVRQVRLFFESAARCKESSARLDAKSGRLRKEASGKYNRSSLEKILLCSASHPKLTVASGLKTGTTLECETNGKSFIYAMPDSPTMRWPSFKEHGSRPSSLRSGSTRHRFTDTESSVSESSDLSGRVSDFGGPTVDDSAGHNLFDSQVEGRYVSPDILDKLRSYGRCFRFVNGRMIDAKGNEIERAKLDPLQVKIYARNDKESVSSSGASSADDDSRSSSPYYSPAVRNPSGKMIAGTVMERQSYGTLSSDFGFP